MKRILWLAVCFFLILPLIVQAQQLRIGVLKIEDAVPVVVAHRLGLFKKHGVQAKIVYFNSALERDAAFEAGSVDCIITDPVASILLKHAGYDIKIVSIALGVKPQDGVFSFLASPGSAIKRLKDLNGKTLAISRNSIIEYVADSILNPRHIVVKKVEIKKMPLRVEMLLSGKVDVAVLPEPLATYAGYRGARLIFADSRLKESLSQTVWAFNGKYLKRCPGIVAKFKSIYNEAVSEINKNPSKYKPVIVKIARVPASILHLYKIPHFSKFTPLGRSSYERYLRWLLKKNLLKKPIPYSSIVYAAGN